MLLLSIFSFQCKEPLRISCKAGPAVRNSLRITLSEKIFLTEGYFFFSFSTLNIACMISVKKSINIVMVVPLGVRNLFFSC